MAELQNIEKKIYYGVWIDFLHSISGQTTESDYVSWLSTTFVPSLQISRISECELFLDFKFVPDMLSKIALKYVCNMLEFQFV